MSEVRLMQRSLRFEMLVYEHQVALPQSDRRYLEEVDLALSGSPSVEGPNKRTPPDDVRLYLDGIEVTPFYIAELKRVLGMQDQPRLRAQYRTALDRWIELARALGAAYGSDPDNDARRAVELLAVDPFADLVDQLGNHTAGFAGYLHVFNFLHTSIDVPSVSLLRVIARARDAGAALDAATVKRLTVANGPCRLFATGWTPPQRVGIVNLTAELRYHDPLEDVVKDLSSRVDQLEQDLNQDLAEILLRVSSGGPIARALAAAAASTAATTTAVGGLRAELGSQSAQLTTLEGTARDLKNAVDHL